MKTRIRKKELKNGRIEYICEYESLKAKSITCMSLGGFFCSIIYFGGYLFTTTMLPNNQESINPISFSLFSMSLITLLHGLYQYTERWNKISYLDSECVFCNLEEAKKAVDGYIFRHNQNKEKLEGEKTKKNNYN